MSCASLLGLAKTAPAAATLGVHDQASFVAALAAARPGDTISLADGLYPALQVERAFTDRVRIVGSRNAKLAGITFSAATNLSLEGLTVTPPGNTRAVILVENGSSKILLDGVLVDGRVESAGAGIRTAESTSEITIQNSELTNCGGGDRCVSPGARDLRILNNRFYDCRSCDFIRGGGAGALVQGNSFEHAAPGACEQGGQGCPHNDHIQIMGGGPWTLVGNRFGPRRLGAASIYVNTGIGNAENPIHDVQIVSNLFTGDAGLYGIRLGVGDGQDAGKPERVSVVNNTILSGSVAAVYLTNGWAGVPAEKRPLVANNIFAVQGAGSCDSGRFVSNLAVSGSSCPGDDRGPANLDGGFEPTAQSTLVLDRADPAFSPPNDFKGRGRAGRPDRGAFERQGPPGPPNDPPPPPPPPNEPPAPPPSPSTPGQGGTPPPPEVPELAIDRIAAAPGGPRTGARFWFRFTLVRKDKGTPLRPDATVCRARVGERALRLVSKGLRGVVVTCTWEVPRGVQGKTLEATLTAQYRGAAASKTVVRRIR